MGGVTCTLEDTVNNISFIFILWIRKKRNETQASTYTIVHALYKGVSVVHVTVGAEHK